MLLVIDECNYLSPHNVGFAGGVVLHFNTAEVSYVVNDDMVDGKRKGADQLIEYEYVTKYKL
jgi:hypothetical protein